MRTPRTSFQTTDGLQSHRAKTEHKKSEISPQNMNRALEQRKQRTVQKTKRARVRPHAPTHAKRADDEERQGASERGRKEVNSACKMLFPFSNIPLIAVSFLTIPAVIYYSIHEENTHTRAGAHAREQMIKKDGERDRKNANSGCNMLSPFSDIPRITVSFRTIPAVIFYSIPKENRHTCAQAREQMIKTHSERDRKDANSARKLGFHFLTRCPLSAHSCRNCHLLF
jgi:hypothetical protein